jgi:hypothetical protein
LEFLDLPAVETPSLESPLECFAGEYVSADDPSISGCKIQVRHEHLIATVEEPTMDVDRGPIGCFREVRLIQQAPNGFYVEAWPHVVQFTEDATGARVGFTLSVSETGWPPSIRKYVRQPQSPLSASDS